MPGARFLAFEGKQQDQTGVNKKDQDTEMADGHEIEVTAESGGVPEVQEEVKQNNEENRARPKEVQVLSERASKTKAPDSLTQGDVRRH